MQDIPFEPRAKVVADPGTVRRLLFVHFAFAALWALLNLVITGGVALFGDFAGATVNVDPPEGGYHFPTDLLLVLFVPTALHLLLAWGTLRRAPWARKGTIALGLATMLVFPVGTLLGLHLVCQGRLNQPSPDSA